MSIATDEHLTATAAETATLLVSFELSQSRWVLTIRAPGSAKPSHFTCGRATPSTCGRVLVASRAGGTAHRRAGAGRQYLRGWSGRVLAAPLAGGEGVESHVVDPASILGRSAGAGEDGSDRRSQAVAQSGGLAGW